MTCIKLCINDDGTMSVSQEEAEPTEGMETEGTPVKDLAEALDVISQMVEAGSMAPEGEMGVDTMSQAPAADPMADPAAEEEAMMSGYNPGVTGR